MTDDLATIFDSEIARPLGEWTDMTRVDACLRTTLGL